MSTTDGAPALRLVRTAAYEAHGLGPNVQRKLAALGDLLLGAEFNVTGLSDPEAIEERHFLDSLSLLAVPPVASSAELADIGSGAGLPALILALALPTTRVTAIESVRKKCGYIERAAETLGLENVVVRCMRAEEYGRSAGREAHDVVVSRALAALPVVAEYSLPLLRIGGVMIAMKGAVSDQEHTQATNALGILGGGELSAMRLDPFEGSDNRWAYRAEKIRATPAEFPRRPGVPAKRPLG
ncbi:MAG: 16S rRNA (guanine(527)-N(7))-methyltransferase RsmG [Actinobacteria bacterium RBG_16_64_13]|nr:MAG: 16S rRNA (guanine(527)-N(7))-methyltransferase RsmG [Actinobacteria bacterium RBG_16_64_13]